MGRSLRGVSAEAGTTGVAGTDPGVGLVVGCGGGGRYGTVCGGH